MATRRHLSFASALAAAAAFASPAAAQQAFTGANFSKAEAIIGGQSRLAQILAEQGALPRPVPTRLSNLAPSRTSEPLAQALGRVSRSAATNKPDVFGSVALKVGRTPLDGKWRSVARAPVVGKAAALARSLRHATEMQRLDAINRYVNARVRFVDDSRQYRRADVWTSANATLNRRRGDCEDYAIAKLQMLRLAGFSARDLYLVVLKDLVRRSDHAVAVVRSGGRMFVLDNGGDTILESEEVRDYRPIFTFAAHGSWTHGYKVRPERVLVAASSPPETSAPTPGAK
jgi:predicted transglutaminase-like cysteine proteinase